MPAAKQLFPRLGRGSWHNKTRDDKGEKGKGKPPKLLLLLQGLAHKHHSSPGMLSRSVQSDSPSATSCPPPEQQASRGTASFGSLKGTFPASNPSKSPNTSIHLSPACTDESCINPAPNGADESLLSCATAQLHQDGPFPLQGQLHPIPKSSHPPLLLPFGRESQSPCRPRSCSRVWVWGAVGSSSIGFFPLL